MEKEKNDIRAIGEILEKAISKPPIAFLNFSVQKSGFIKQTNENFPGYETSRSISIFYPYKKARGSPCKGPPGRIRGPGIDYGYFTEHPPNSVGQEKPNSITYIHLTKFKFLLFINT